MKITFGKIVTYSMIASASLFVLSGCTATSSPGLAQAKYYGKRFKVDSNDNIKVIVTNKKGLDIKSEGKKRLAEVIKRDIDLLKKYNVQPGNTNKYLIQVHITNYDKGNAFARFMIAGAGQIHINGTITVYELPSKIKIETFDIAKTFAWGGIYGGATTIKEVGEGFAMGVAETVTHQKRK